MRYLFGALVCALLSLHTSPAAAQSVFEPIFSTLNFTSPGAGQGLLVFAVTTAWGAPLSTTTTGVVVTVMLLQRPPLPAATRDLSEADRQASLLLDAMLQEHPQEFQDMLILGRGPLLTVLSPQVRRRLARVLRERRAHFQAIALMEPGLTRGATLLRSLRIALHVSARGR